MPDPLPDASHLLPGKPPAPWQEEQLPGFPASLHSRKPGTGSNLPGAPPRKPTHKFTAGTCHKCGHIILAGQIHGLLLDLEPTTLNDLTEYQAIRDGIPTYDLWPDRTARRRHLEEIKWPERVARHARHTCGTTYGTDPRPDPPAPPAPASDTPPF